MEGGEKREKERERRARKIDGGEKEKREEGYRVHVGETRTKRFLEEERVGRGERKEDVEKKKREREREKGKKYRTPRRSNVWHLERRVHRGTVMIKRLINFRLAAMRLYTRTIIMECPPRLQLALLR